MTNEKEKWEKRKKSAKEDIRRTQKKSVMGLFDEYNARNATASISE